MPSLVLTPVLVLSGPSLRDARLRISHPAPYWPPWNRVCLPPHSPRFSSFFHKKKCPALAVMALFQRGVVRDMHAGLQSCVCTMQSPVLKCAMLLPGTLAQALVLRKYRTPLRPFRYRPTQALRHVRYWYSVPYSVRVRCYGACPELTQHAVSQSEVLFRVPQDVLILVQKAPLLSYTHDVRAQY